jgi:hypothetical protein
MIGKSLQGYKQSKEDWTEGNWMVFGLIKAKDYACR